MADLSSNPKHAELERRKQNLHKVYNPTNQDHKIVFNAAVSPEVWTIKAMSEEIVPEFVCTKYLKEMSNLIIYSQSDEKIKSENDRRTSIGLQPMNLYDEQFRFESRSLKITEDQYVKMMAQLYRGLYKEYGVDATPEITPLVQGSSKPAFETALKRVFDGDLPEINEPKTSLEPQEQTIKPSKPSIIIPDPISTPKSDLKSKIDAEIKNISK